MKPAITLGLAVGKDRQRPLNKLKPKIKFDEKGAAT
jgi:hypothetical protein